MANRALGAAQTVYNWEARGKVARPAAQKRLAELGICMPSDWLEPAGGGDLAKHRNAPEGESRDLAHPFHSLHSQGMVRVAASTPHVRTADVTFNRDAILAEARRAHRHHVDLLVFPELCLSSYALDDLHLQTALLDAVEGAAGEIVAASADLCPVMLVGAPVRHDGRLYNCALVIASGCLLGVVPKSYLPNYREFYEKRWFAHGRSIRGETIAVKGIEAPFGCDLVFACNQLPHFKLFVEICEDLWAAHPPSSRGALGGATILANLSASNITIGKSDERHMLCRSQSARATAAYVYSAAGHGESTTDLCLGRAGNGL